MKMKKRGIYERIINTILDILIVVFGIFLLISIYKNVQIKILGNDYSSFFGYSTFEVQTGSMADTINPGDWIIVKNTKNIKLDDIITYSKKGDFITHRVVETYKNSYITKGDANNSKDEPINESQIVGKVIKILPGFGIIRKTFFNPLVLITLIITLYAISYVLRSSKQKNNVVKRKKFNYKEKIDELVNILLTKLLNYIKKQLKNKDEKDEEKTNENLYDESDIKIELPEMNIEDMDKTLYFRRISVSKKEINNIDGKNNAITEEVEIEPILEKVEENEIEERINLINNKRKKFKNIVEKSIYIKKEEINEIIDILLLEDKLRTNEPTIKESMLNGYIDGKYYNYCGNVNIEFNKRTVLSKMDIEIKKLGSNLKDKYKGNDNKYVDKVNKYVNVFILVNSLEYINITKTDLDEKRELYKNKIVKYLKIEDENSIEIKNMINQIISTQKLYQAMINHILDKANTNTFKLILNKISGKKNLYAVSLEHNLLFSKVYSEYIVDKTYSEGIIAEDKVMVLLNLLLTNIVRDMLDMEDNKKYFMHIPNSVYEKPNKMDKIFKMFEDEYAKNNIVIVVEYQDVVEYNKQISELRKKGYHFAIILNTETQVNADENKYMEIAEYVFADKKIMSYNLLSSIPNDLAKSIINDDLANKLNSFGGE